MTTNPPSCAPLLMRIALVFGALAALLVMGAITLPVEQLEWMYSESGPIEIASEFVWIGLALFSVALFRGSITSIAGALLALGAAAREADWHKEFTDESMLKPKYYLSGEYPLESQIIGGVVVALLLASLALVTWRFFRLASTDPRLVPPWAGASFAAMAIFVFSKLADRMPGILKEDFETRLPERLYQTVRSLEEGLELFLPAFFAVAMISLHRDRYTSAERIGVGGDGSGSATRDRR